VWQVSWSHPRFGNILASCGFDKKVLIWKEISLNNWEKIYEYTEHKNSVNSLAFAPQEYGLILLCGSSDGSISLHEYKSKLHIII
jgi:protein transport protein SEC13